MLLFCIQFFDGQNVVSRWYDTDSGLPQNSVKDIIRDRYGFIWLSTENGLVRYDGSHFVTFNRLQVKNNRFTVFLGDIAKDSIYNLTAFDENTVLISKRNARVLSKPLGKVREILNERTKNAVIVKNDQNPFPGVSRFCIPFDQQHAYYLWKDGTILYNNQRIAKLKGLRDHLMSDVFCLGKTLFVLSRSLKKIYQIKGAEITLPEVPEVLLEKDSKIYWSMINDQAFVINKGMIYKIETGNKRLILRKITEYDVSRSPLTSIYLDEPGNSLYVGTLTNGLNIIQLNRFYTVTKSDRDIDNIFYAQLPFGPDRVITPSGEVYNENGLLKQYHFRNANRFFSLYDEDKNIIVQTDDHIVRYLRSTDYSRKEKLYFKKPVSFIWRLQNEYAVVFYNPQQGSQVVFYKDGRFTKPFLQFSAPHPITSAQEYDRSHWLIGTRDGVYLVGRSSAKTEKISSESLNVREIVRTSDGSIWVLTRGKGFFLYRDNRLVRMPQGEEEGLLYPNSILEDRNGFFWISTDNGLFKILRKNLLRYAKDKNEPVHYYKYSKEDGFNTNEFNGGCSPGATVLQNGKFVFPSIKGMVFFDPREVKSIYPHNFFLERMVFSDPKSYRSGNTVYLENNFYKAELSIDVPYYDNRSNLIIETRLKNSNTDRWEKLNSEGIYTITNLGPGSYDLIVRVLVSPDRYLYKTLHIHVKYLFYQTLAFKLGVLLVMMILTIIMIQWRIRKQELKKKELENIIQERTRKLKDTVSKLEETRELLRKESIQQKKLLETISHDIVTPIKFLSISAKKIYEMEECGRDEQKMYFENFYKSTVEFYNFVKTLKQYAEIYNIPDEAGSYDLYEMVELKKGLFETAAREQGTVIVNKINRPAFSRVNQNVMAVIIHNLIDNAVKNTVDGVVEIQVAEDDVRLQLEIIDTGKGMTAEQIKYYQKVQDNIENEKLMLQKYSLGLHLILQLLQMVNGRITFKNNSPRGTIVSVTIKKTKYE
ncbi:ATP-binding protein [Chryseobacterium sp. RRHN12]|uniref:ATP-binding protein n=1 Tax=Chryseobacterium sp. RRHN12 TaxID=3437884 RepID=UPI003D9BD65B